MNVSMGREERGSFNLETKGFRAEFGNPHFFMGWEQVNSWSIQDEKIKRSLSLKSETENKKTRYLFMNEQ